MENRQRKDLFIDFKEECVSVSEEILKNKSKIDKTKCDKLSVASGFNGAKKDQLEDFIKEGGKLIKKDLARPRAGGVSRYSLKIGYENFRAAVAPTVSTSEGMEIMVIWNIPGKKGIQKITEEFSKLGISIDLRPYIWLPDLPSFPNEFQS